MSKTIISHVYRVDRLVRVNAGNKFFVALDLGFGVTSYQAIILNQLAIPEQGSLGSKESLLASDAAHRAKDWFLLAAKKGLHVFARTYRVDKDGYWVADVWVDDPKMGTLSGLLLDASLAVISTRSEPMEWRQMYLTRVKPV